MLESVEEGADPLGEYYRTAAGLEMSRAFGRSFDDIMDNFDVNVRAWTGRDFSPTLSGARAIADSFHIGTLQMQQARLARDWMKGGGTDTALEQQLDEIQGQMDKLVDNTPRPWYVSALKFGAMSAPFTAEVAGAGLAAGAAGAGLAIVGAGAAGLTIGSGGALGIGAAAATVGMYQAAGAAIGGFSESMRLTEGLEYYRMRKRGVRDDIAGPLASVSGGVQSLLEVGLGSVPGALTKLGGVKVDTLAGGIVKRLAVSGKWGALAKSFASYAGEIGEEGLEEGAQQIVSSIADATAAELQGQGVERSTAEEVAREVWESVKGGALGAVALGVPGFAADLRGNLRDAGALRSLARSTDEEAFLAKAKDSPMLEGLDEAKRAEVLKAIYQMQRSASAEGTAPRPAAEESGPVKMAQGPYTPGQEYRDASGRLYAEISTKAEREDESGATVVEARLKVGDPENKQTYVYVDHSLVTSADGGEKLIVDRIDYNRPAEEVAEPGAAVGQGAAQETGAAETDVDIPASLKGLVKEAFNELASRYPGVEIEWNTATPMEEAIKAELEADSPTGGLQWFFPDRPAGEQLSRQELRRQVLQAFQNDRNIKDEVDGILALADRMAEKKGVTTDAMLAAAFEGQAISRTGTTSLNKAGTADAGVSFRDNSGREVRPLELSRADLGRIRAVVKLGKTADFAAFSHEFFHAVERLWFDEGEVAAFERALGKQRQAWQTEDLEYLADQWEHYLETGAAPDEGLRGAFEKLAGALRRFVQEFLGLEKRYGDRYALSPELKAAYDNLLAKPESGLAKAEGASSENRTEAHKEGQGEAQEAQGGESHQGDQAEAVAVQPEPSRDAATEAALELFHTPEVAEPNPHFEEDFAKVEFIELEITPDLEHLTRPELRDVAKQEYERQRAAPVEVPGLGPVRFSSGGKGKTFSNSADPVKLFALLKIKELLEQSASLGTKPSIVPDEERNVKKYHYRASKFRLAGQEYVIGTTIKEQTDGTFHYNSTPFNMESPESRAEPTDNVGGVLPGDQNPAAAELNISVRKVFPGVKGLDEAKYLAHTRADLAGEAASFESPEEYRQYLEGLFGDEEDERATADLSEAEKADFYKKLWEEGRAAAAAEDQVGRTALETDPDGDFLRKLRAPGGVEAFLEELWGATAYIDQAEKMGIEDETEGAEVERLGSIRDRIDREAHPTIKSAMLTVGRNGRKLSAPTRKRVLALIESGTLDYRTLDAQIRNDRETLEELQAREEDRTRRFGVLPEPANAAQEGLTIAGRARLERAFENEEIRKKIRTGDISGAEIEQLVGDLDREKAKAIAEREALKAERATLEAKLDDTESDWVRSNQLLMDARKEISQADEKIARLTKQAALDPEALEAELRSRKTLSAKLDALEKAHKQKTAALRQADRAKAAAAKQAAVKKAEQRIRAIEQRKKAAIELRKEKIRIGQEITRERSLKNVNHEEWEAIRKIQAIVDPNFRRATIAWRGEIIEISKLREDPQLLADVLKDAGLAAKIQERLEKKPLNEWTLSELEELNKQVERLESLGRTKLAARRAEDKLKASTIGTRILTTVERSKSYEPPSPYGSAELEEKLKRKDRKNFALLTFFDMDRVATFFDGGKPGGFWEILVGRQRAAQAREQVERERREAAILKIIDENKIDINDLKRKDITIDLGRSMSGDIATLSKEDLMFAMVALRDYGGGRSQDWLGSRGAYIFGNFFSESEKLMKNSEGNYTMTDTTLKHFAGRVETAIKKAISENLGEAELALADAMSTDWAREYARLRQAMIDNFNQEVVKVEHYIPLRRQSSSYSSLEGELLEEHANLAGLNTAPGKGMAVERLKIGIRHQLPVRTDILGLYFDSVRKQEHLIAFADYFKVANRVFKKSDLARELRQKVRLTWGEGGLRYIDNYLSELANPQEFKSLTNAEKAFRFLRGNQGVAYLGLRLSSVLKQVLTSPIPYVAYAGPAYFAKSSYEAMADPLHFQARVEALSPYLRSRQASPVLDALRGGGDPKAVEALKKVQAAIMKPLEWADRSTVAIGWYSVYLKAKADGMQEDQARIMADDVTHKSQPSVSPADLAPLFKEGGEFAKVFTQFQIPMSRIFQQAFFDLPNAVKNGEYMRAIGIAVAYALCGLSITLVTGTRGDDDEEKRRDWIFSAFTQFTDSVPFVGSLATDLVRAGLTGDRETRLASTLLPAAEKGLGGAATMLDGLWNQNTERLGRGMLTTLEGVGIGAGIPTQAIKDVVRATSEGPAALLGRKK